MGGFLGCVSNTSENQDVSCGIVKKRGCTDCLWIVFFLAFLCGMGYVVYLCLSLGDPNRLIYGIDSWGNACNSKNKKLDLTPPVALNGRDTTGLENAYYFNFLAAGSAGQIESTVLCVSDCPRDQVRDLEHLKNLSLNHNIHLCRYDIAPENFTDDGTLSGDTCPPIIASLGPHKKIMHRCIPAIAMSAGISMFEAAADSGTDQLDAYTSSSCEKSGNLFERVAGDLMQVYDMVGYLSLASVGVGLFVTILMRFFAAILIRIIIIGMTVGSVAASAMCWYLWWDLREKLLAVPESDRLQDDKDYVSYWLYGAIVITVLAVVFILVLLIMRKRIALVIQLFHEAGKAVAKMPFLMFLPLFTLVLQIIVTGGLAYGFLYIFSAGNPKVEGGKVEFEKSETLFYMQWYYLLGILWILQFLFACQTMIIAGSIGEWFFTRDKSSLQCCGPLLGAMWRLVRYHLGTVLFGSFVIAVVQLIRIILLYLQNKLKGKSNKFVIYLLKILSCCFWCLEKLLKVLTKNAYIMTAITGCNLCTGGLRAIKIVTNNILRVGAINSIGVFTLFIGKLLIVSIVIVIGIFVFAERSDICYVWVPLVLLGGISYGVAHCFLSVYGMAIDTIFMCFCIDSDYNDGRDQPFFMSKGLMKFVDKAAVNYSRENIQPIRDGPGNNNNNLNNLRGKGVGRAGKPERMRVRPTNNRTMPQNEVEW